MIPVYYYSSTSGLTRKFAHHLGEQTGRAVFDLSEKAVRTSETTGPWVLLTPSYKAGNAANATLPKPVLRFLASANNRRRMIGIVGSGNRNFGEFYQAAARQLAEVSKRPILFEFELSGTPEDVTDCATVLAKLDEAILVA